MTTHNDEAHALSTRNEAQTRHDEAHVRCSRRSDEAHHETHTRHAPTRHNGSPPLGGPCRVFRASERGT
jgi:hypothetical protein